MEFIEPLILARWLHVIGAAVLLGTGGGIAFFMVMAHRTRDAALIAHVAGTVVIADLVFTASAVIVQPLTGYWLTRLVGWSLTEGWIVLSLALYLFTGLFWLPVVWIQKRIRDVARESAKRGDSLPEGYFRLYAAWFACGWPAFLAVLTIFWLMLARPAIPWLTWS